MSLSFSAVCAIWNSSAAFPLISSSPGITKSGFFPGLKTMAAATDSGKTNAAATKTKNVRMTKCMGCGRGINLSVPSSSSGGYVNAAEGPNIYCHLPECNLFQGRKTDQSSLYSLHLNLTDQQKIRIGACAWSFDDWRGAFYPPDLPNAQWLEFYANYFPAVEVDSTFYAAPSENTVRRWIEVTPAAFRFACKLPREITHARRLRDCTAELNSFLHALEALASKLQVILIQLPPSFAPKDGKRVLREFLGGLPR